MRTLTMLGVLGLVALAPLTGCANRYKQRIAELSATANELSAKNQALQQELARTDAQRSTLLGEISSRNEQIRQLNQRLRELQAQKAAQPAEAEGWERTLMGDRVSLGSDVLFASGKADLTSAGRQRLDGILRDLRSTYAGRPVLVYGYTDSDPIRRSKWTDNLELSAHRAMAVTRYLTEHGIDAETIDTVAKGATNFVAPNNSPADKQKNRRVEIIVVRE